MTKESLTLWEQKNEDEPYMDKSQHNFLHVDAQMDEFQLSLSGKEYPWRNQNTSLLEGISIASFSINEAECANDLPFTSNTRPVCASNPIQTPKLTRILDFSPLTLPNKKKLASPICFLAEAFPANRMDLIPETQNSFIIETQKPGDLEIAQEGKNTYDNTDNEWLGQTQRPYLETPLKNILDTPLKGFSVPETVVFETPVGKGGYVQNTMETLTSPIERISVQKPAIMDQCDVKIPETVKFQSPRLKDTPNNFRYQPILRKKRGRPSKRRDKISLSSIITRLPIRKVLMHAAQEDTKKAVVKDAPQISFGYSRISLFSPGLVWAPSRVEPAFLSPFLLVGRDSQRILALSLKFHFKILSQDNEKILIRINGPFSSQSTRFDIKEYIEYKLEIGSKYFVRLAPSASGNKSELVMATFSGLRIVGSKLQLRDISFLFTRDLSEFEIHSLKNIYYSCSSSNDTISVGDASEKIFSSGNSFRSRDISPFHTDTIPVYDLVTTYYCETGTKKRQMITDIQQNWIKVTSLDGLEEALAAKEGKIYIMLSPTAKVRQPLNPISPAWIKKYAQRTAKFLTAAAAAISRMNSNILFQVASSTNIVWKIDSTTASFPAFGEWAIIGPCIEWKYILKAGGGVVQHDLTKATKILVSGDSLLKLGSFSEFEGKMVVSADILSKTIVDYLVSMLVPF